MNTFCKQQCARSPVVAFQVPSRSIFESISTFSPLPPRFKVWFLRLSLSLLQDALHRSTGRGRDRCRISVLIALSHFVRDVIHSAARA